MRVFPLCMYAVCLNYYHIRPDYIMAGVFCWVRVAKDIKCGKKYNSNLFEQFVIIERKKKKIADVLRMYYRWKFSKIFKIYY